MSILMAANLALRFLLELCALTALGYWGFQSGRGPVLKTILGLGAPLLAALAWGAFVAPKAAVAVPEPVRLGIELLVFGAAVAALFAIGRPGLAWTFALTVLLNRVLLTVWGQ